MNAREELAAQRFQCSIRERALFEAGVKLGAAYHQFIGTPVCESSKDALEIAIERGIMVQPYVKSAKVRIVFKERMDKSDEYSYASLRGDMLDVCVVIGIDDVRVTACLRYDEELKYPLMYVSDIEGDA